MPTVRPLTDVELERIPEVDVSEDGSAIYVQSGVRLERIRQAHRRPVLTAADWAPEIASWRGHVRDGGSAFGCFDGEQLVGFAVLRAALTPEAAQLAALYVDRRWRRQGVAGHLLDEVEREAGSSGASRLYVSAVRSDSAVPFYLQRGFAPVAEPHPELFRLEPEDVHMSLDLSR